MKNRLQKPGWKIKKEIELKEIVSIAKNDAVRCFSCNELILSGPDDDSETFSKVSKIECCRMFFCLLICNNE